MSDSEPSPHILHLGLAEQGKLHALAGRYEEALRHYREAIRLAVSSKAPDVFFRHYTECVMEALEAQESYEPVIRFLEEASAHYAGLSADAAIHKRDHAAMLARLGAVLLKAGRAEEARKRLEEAVDRAGPEAPPLAVELRGWLARGYAVDAGRVRESQRRHNAFVVRADRVEASLARPLPAREAASSPLPSGR
ncbi:MAG: hypothetical protein RIB45_18045 [Marivibrio sp.]|uniref:hypothetical protein n=1 Tax=Marivibrio sp. TaxID=2039719 RepID=UPI0032EEC0B6